MKTIMAMTIKQPYAWAIFNAGMNIINLPFQQNYQGLLAIHAAKTLYTDETTIRKIVFEFSSKGISLPKEITLGAIIGIVDVVGCVRESSSKWFEQGKWGFVITNPRQLIKPIVCRGNLGLWTVPWQSIESKL